MKTNHPIIIDNGKHLIKAGFSTSEKPSVQFPPIIGRVTNPDLNADEDQDIYIAEEATENMQNLSLTTPIINREIDNFQEMFLLWDYLYYDKLKTDSQDHPVLLTESIHNPNNKREKISEIFFEKFAVPSFYLYSSSVLALYSLGRVTGIVLDSGEDCTESVAIFEGFNLKRTYTKSDLGGKDLTEFLTKEVLESEICNFVKKREDIKFIKEENCYVSLDFEKENKNKEIVLPDGNKVLVNDLLYRIPEILFNPQIDVYNVPELIYNSVQKVDESDSLNSELLNNIVLCGRNSLFRNFGDRVKKELNALLPKEFETKVLKNNNDFPEWEGGAIVSELSTFKTSWVTMDEYNENGPSIVRKKCF